MRSGLASNMSVAVVCSLLPRRGVGCPVSVSAAGVVAGVRKGRLQLLEDWLLDLVSHNLSKRMSGFLCRVCDHSRTGVGFIVWQHAMSTKLFKTHLVTSAWTLTHCVRVAPPTSRSDLREVAAAAGKDPPNVGAKARPWCK